MRNDDHRAPNPVLEAAGLGQSIWLDYIDRDLIVTGQLEELISKGLRGLTSNPTIFQKAISQGEAYDDDLIRLGREGRDAAGIFDGLALKDIGDAADRFRPVYDHTDGLDGYVSIEVNPQLAANTEETLVEARRLFHTLNRPNVLIKVPATPEGVPAVRQLISEGINVNVTLIFSLDAYRQVANAYIDGLEILAKKPGADLSKVASVASFFVSRMDTLVDNRLPNDSSLKGKAGIANAKLAYADFQRIFSDPRFRALSSQGARVQRPLWASTSVKNPAYPELMYVDALMGPQTVNTLPPATLNSFLENGTVQRNIDHGADEAQQHLAALADAGVDYNAATEQLLAEGVKAFTDSFVQLMDGIEQKRQKLATGSRA